MKNNIDFYHHYANSDQHPKFKMLRTRYGWDGEGRFWALNNRIALAENCILDLSKKRNKAAIACDFGFNIKEFEDYIDFLLHEDCELIKEVSTGLITTDIIQENFTRVAGNREKARERKQRYLEKVPKGSGELNKSSGEKNKKGKSKSKVNIKKELYVFLENQIKENSLQTNSVKIIEFFNYRMNDHIKGKKQPYGTAKGITGLFIDILSCQGKGLDINYCLEYSMQKEWLTPNSDYFKSKPKQDSHNGFQEKDYGEGTPEKEIAWMQD